MGATITTLTGQAAEAEVRALSPRRRVITAEARRAQVDAWELFEDAAGGNLRAKMLLAESLATSDFPKVFGAALDAKLLSEYQAISPVWQQFAARDTLPDFRPQSWVDLLGGQGALSLVGEGAPYPRRPLSEADGSYKVDKYGDTIGLTWEMFINDRLNAFRQLPNRLAVAAREMEDRIATSMLTDGDGPNTALFSATAAKGALGAAGTTLLAGNPVLTEDSLTAAILAIQTRRDFDGRPVVLNGAVLVVPTALQTVAERIVGATEIRETVGSKLIIRTNPLAGRVKVCVNPWLQVLDANVLAPKSWYLLPEPSANGRPAIVLGFLAGHEVPDLRVKNDAGNRVGGGAIAPEEGSFEFDTIDYRVRHILGAGSVDANQVAYSAGT